MIHVDKNRESDNACSSNSVKNHAREGIITNTFYNMRYTISKPVYDVTDNIKKEPGYDMYVHLLEKKSEHRHTRY